MSYGSLGPFVAFYAVKSRRLRRGPARPAAPEREKAPYNDAVASSRLLPRISATERSALEAGTVWLDGDVFSGRPDFRRRLAEPWPALTDRERAFLDGPVTEACRLVDDEALRRSGELPAEVWSFLRRARFFGLVLPERWGGLGFSPLAASTVFARLASHSLALSAIVLIPNSVGPGELLLHHGTDEQKERWLPRLARGDEIPCFALTEPGAGSDAASLVSRGVVRRGPGGVPRIRLDWEKRYITLAPVATLIGLAVRLEDPDELLGRGTEPGITFVLVPAGLPGVEIGARHDPLGVPIPNGPTRGRGVEVGVDAILGGPAAAGRGWPMLMEALAGGRAISLPAQSVGGAWRIARVVGAYAQVRRQFGLPLARFEAVGEILGRIAGTTYLMDAARVATAGALARGERPAVVAAAMKVRQTELGRALINDAMDLLGGAGICLGPRNLLARGYLGAPIGITVEGSNVLTRGLIVFGQGIFRAHPHALPLLTALTAGRVVRAGWIALCAALAFAGHLARALGHAPFRAALARSPIGGPTARSFRRLRWASAWFAVVADLALFTLGARLKARESLAGRLADAFSWWVTSFAALHRFEAEGRPEADLPLVRWAAERGLGEIQRSLADALASFPGPARWLARGPLAAALRLAPLGRPPSDAATAAAAAVLTRPGAARDRLTGDLFLPDDPTAPLAALEAAFAASLRAEELERIGSPAAREARREADERAREVLAVDEFPHSKSTR